MTARVPSGSTTGCAPSLLSAHSPLLTGAGSLQVAPPSVELAANISALPKRVQAAYIAPSCAPPVSSKATHALSSKWPAGGVIATGALHVMPLSVDQATNSPPC